MARLPGWTIVDALAGVLLTWLVAHSVLDPPGPAFPGPPWIAWLAGAAVALPLTVRRRRPLPVLAAVVTVAAAATAAGVTGFGIIVVTWYPAVLALYTAAARSRRSPAVFALTGTLAAAAGAIPWLYARTGITSADAPGSEVPLWWQVELTVVVLSLLVAWVAGRLIRWRRTIRAETAHRLARDAVAEERLRIARELHDIVGHSLSLIAVKATVANHIAEQRPAESRAALQTIERTSRSALTEIRRLLDVLRADDDPAAALTPAPGTAGLPELADRLRSAGLRIDLEDSGTGELPAGVDVTVYRIVQESLTNVIKHAGAARCRVSVRARDGEVRIEVTDDGRGPRPSGRRSGQGLIGMRERVTMYGGELITGPGPGGGFQVIAVIPYTPAEETA